MIARDRSSNITPYADLISRNDGQTLIYRVRHNQVDFWVSKFILRIFQHPTSLSRRAKEKDEKTSDAHPPRRLLYKEPRSLRCVGQLGRPRYGQLHSMVVNFAFRHDKGTKTL
jgi:hypothetical protein